jgi:hypothetical protein
MKSSLCSILFVLISIFSFSQIPNPGFENWVNMGSYENPVSWGTMNNYTSPLAVYTATKGTPGSPGTAYLKLTSRTVGSAVVNGIAVSGILDSITLSPKSGFPFSLRPQSFTGKWQHMIYGTSQGSVSVTLTRWNSSTGQRETVATASQTLSGMAMAWATFSINFAYSSGSYPDTCIIVLKASGANPTQNDYLWVDNLAFSGTVTGVIENVGKNFSITAFPNPANDQIEFICSELMIGGGRLIIFDITGKRISEELFNTRSLIINTSDFSNGSYIFKLVNSYDVQYYSGKFSVIKK